MDNFTALTQINERIAEASRIKIGTCFPFFVVVFGNKHYTIIKLRNNKVL